MQTREKDYFGFMCQLPSPLSCAKAPHASQILKQQQLILADSSFFNLKSHAVCDFDSVPLSAADNISRQFGARSFFLWLLAHSMLKQIAREC